MTDKTNWRAMLKGDTADIDLGQARDTLLEQIGDEIRAVNKEFGEGSVEVVDEPAVGITYPVLAYPTKIKSFNLDKDPEASGTLQGIKGQYLMFDTGVINLRKYTGYHLTVQAG